MRLDTWLLSAAKREVPEPDDLLDIGRNVPSRRSILLKRSKRDDRLCEGLARSATAAKMLR
jgi:hypothetical protein